MSEKKRAIEGLKDRERERTKEREKERMVESKKREGERNIARKEWKRWRGRETKR